MTDLILLLADIAILLALIIIKTIGFYKVTRRRSLSKWLFFSGRNIINTDTYSKQALKRRQNVYTVFIIILSLALLVLFKMQP